MDSKQLEYFVQVAELGSFTKAANTLNIAQPALSRKIRQLEVELHQTLLLRNGRGVSVTEAGKVLLEHGRGVLHQLERTREAMGRVRGTLAGHVVLGLPPSLSRILSVLLARAFREVMPHASLSICEGLSVDMQESLRNGRLDLALLYNPVPSPDIDIIPLCEEPLYLVERVVSTHTAAAVTLSELAQTPLVIPSRPHAIRMLIEAALAAQGYHPQIAFEIDSVPAILELVADGLGGAVLSRLAVMCFEPSRALQMRAIGMPAVTTYLALASSSRRAMTLTQRTMLDLVQRLVQQAFAVESVLST
ncbi:LysR family transcriptional regulator [Neisseriaceae bacterium TC5R-5]|nr:LysR family transcriptional regulator [Neisseriaceae bacterium TC5R-5]